MDWKKKKSHYNSRRVSLHEAPTKNIVTSEAAVEFFSSQTHTAEEHDFLLFIRYSASLVYTTLPILTEATAHFNKDRTVPTLEDIVIYDNGLFMVASNDQRGT